jgi:predicted ribosome quality control (RQC) complex YloA/Tae2 family protein
MDETTLQAVVEEMVPVLKGNRFGRIYQLTRSSIAFDPRSRDGRFVLIDAAPGSSRIHLINRSVKVLEKASLPLSQFSLVLKKQLSGALITDVWRDPGDRIVRIEFETEDYSALTSARTLVAQLTGKSSNLLLLDQDQRIIDALRSPRGEGQLIGDEYAPPPRSADFERPKAELGKVIEVGPNGISAALDAWYERENAEQLARARLAAESKRLTTQINRQKKLLKNLEKDLAAHGDPEEQKKIANLLLANQASVPRSGGNVKLIDYFTEGEPEVEVEVDEHLSLAEEANRRFQLYRKGRNARTQIAERLQDTEKEIKALERKLASLNIDELVNDEVEPKSSEKQKAAGKDARFGASVRTYKSSDGFEILIGRSSKDNDILTFKIAKPNDLWLHAADYPGSHVVVRNQTRKEIPHRTIVEAAQLSAFFSQARKDSKVDVHYTARKYLTKPKSSAAGLVRMSTFRNITVEPAEAGEKI